MTALWLKPARADVVHDVVIEPGRRDWREKLGPGLRPPEQRKRPLAPVRRPIRRPQSSLAL